LLDWENRPLRSLLFTPGNHPRKLAKVGTFGSDASVLDLEDAVADAEKESARATVRSALEIHRSGGALVIVRVNGPHTGRLEADVAAVVREGLGGIMVPKVETPEALIDVDRLVETLERQRGLEEGQLRLLALIETARGLVRCEEIAAAAPDRVYTLIFGLGDFTVDLGIDVTPDATELLYARSRVVIAARAAGLAQPLDGPYLDLQNIDGLVADTVRSRQLGFQGRVVIYPPQVEPVQRTYSQLSEHELELARRVVEGFESAEAQGSASIQVDGRFVDYPIYRRALHKLRLHEAFSEAEGTQ